MYANVVLLDLLGWRTRLDLFLSQRLKNRNFRFVIDAGLWLGQGSDRLSWKS